MASAVQYNLTKHGLVAGNSQSKPQYSAISFFAAQLRELDDLLWAG